MKLALLAFVVGLLLVSGSVNGQPEGQSTDPNQRGSDSGDHNATPDRGNQTSEADGQGDAGERVNLTGDSDQNAPRLLWDFHGNPRHLREYQVYRSTDNQAAQLLATVDAPNRTFTDTSTSSSHVYTYYVQVLHQNGSQGARSNSASTTAYGCEWLVIDPHDPQVIHYHLECLPVPLPIAVTIFPRR